MFVLARRNLCQDSSRRGDPLKRISRPIIISTCLFALFSFTTGNSFSMELIFKDRQYAFQTLRPLGYAVSGGADIGEVLKTAYSIQEGDDESWYREWMKTAEQREKAGDDFLSRGREISARQELFKASNYYRTAEFFLHTNPQDPRIVDIPGLIVHASDMLTSVGVI